MDDPHILHSIALASKNDRTMSALRQSSRAYDTLLKRYPSAEDELYDVAAEANGPQLSSEVGYPAVEEYRAFGKLHRGGDRPASSMQLSSFTDYMQHEHMKKGVEHRDDNKPSSYITFNGTQQNPLRDWFQHYKINGRERRTDGGYTYSEYVRNRDETEHQRRVNDVLEDIGDKPAVYYTGPMDEPYFQMHYRHGEVHNDTGDRPAIRYDAANRSQRARTHQTPNNDHALETVAQLGRQDRGVTELSVSEYRAWARDGKFDRRNQGYPIEVIASADGQHHGARWIPDLNYFRPITAERYAQYQHTPQTRRLYGKRKREE